MRMLHARAVVLTASLLGVVAACGDSESSPSGSSAPVIDPGDGGNYEPQLDPADFADVIDNAYLPLSVGSTWRYEGESDGQSEVTEIIVTPDRKVVMGISAFVVRDTVTSDGELVEDTYDWFAQDTSGNVWYLGEETKEYENGQVVSTEGSWEAGVDGALPGIVMPAVPKVNAIYRQEFYVDVAEDMMQIIDVGGTVSVDAGNYSDVVRTRDWTPLQPEVVEEKVYAPGVGMVAASIVSGGSEAVELVEFLPG